MSEPKAWNGRYECQDCGGPLMVECDYSGHATLIAECLDPERPHVLSGTDPDREDNSQESTWGPVYCRNCYKNQPFKAAEEMGVAYLEYDEFLWADEEEEDA